MSFLKPSSQLLNLPLFLGQTNGASSDHIWDFSIFEGLCSCEIRLVNVELSSVEDGLANQPLSYIMLLDFGDYCILVNSKSLSSKLLEVVFVQNYK